VLVAPGTYTGTGDWVINPLGKPITIRATGTPEETILDGESARLVVKCTSGEGTDTIIEGFTITGGSSAYDGGGIYCSDSSPTITGCTISGNTATGMFGIGGGIWCHSSSPTITGCTISGNTATYGGGISCSSDSSPTITDCTISDNTATYGGGIFCSSSSPTLMDTVVCGNDPDQINGSWHDNGGNTVSDECPPDCPDVDGDGMVGVNDVLAVVAAWGSDDPDADIDGDGTVGTNDLLSVIGAWGPCE
jgi:parallel beta-helix repeat protein